MAISAQRTPATAVAAIKARGDSAADVMIVATRLAVSTTKQAMEEEIGTCGPGARCRLLNGPGLTSSI
jgi:hypothetical protein